MYHKYGCFSCMWIHAYLSCTPQVWVFFLHHETHILIVHKWNNNTKIFILKILKKYKEWYYIVKTSICLNFSKIIFVRQVMGESVFFRSCVLCVWPKIFFALKYIKWPTLLFWPRLGLRCTGMCFRTTTMVDIDTDVRQVCLWATLSTSFT